MAQIHFVLQGKGGVGKSLVSSLLFQHFQERGKPVHGIDTDPVNATFASYDAYQATPLAIMNGDMIDPRQFDQLIETLMAASEEDVFVIDNGAATFVPLCAYLHENDVLPFLQENGSAVYFHTVLTGGQGMGDTVTGLGNLFRNFRDVPTCIWINEYFGKAEVDGTGFEQSALYEAHKRQIHGLVKITEVRKETFGYDMDQMLRRKLSFAEVRQNSTFNLMGKQRLGMIWRDIDGQIDHLHF